MHLNIKKDKDSLSLEYESNDNKKFPISLVILLLALVLAILSAKNTEQFKCLNNVINHLAVIYKTFI